MATVRSRTVIGIAAVTWILALAYVSSNLHYMQQREEQHQLLEERWRSAEKTLQQQHELTKNHSAYERADHAETVRLLRMQLARKRLSIGGGEEKRQKKKEKKEEKKGEKKVEKKEEKELYSSEHKRLRKLIDERIRTAFLYAKKYGTNSSAELMQGQLFSLMNLSASLGQVDGADQWRKEHLGRLTSHIQSTITAIQHPASCSKARILLCDLDKACGFGCQLHHVAYCMIIAFGEGRTLVMQRNGEGWSYSKQGWTAAFLPVTNCTANEAIGREEAIAYSINSSARVVQLGIVDALGNKNRPPTLPLAFPASISAELLKHHANPPVFWIGQFVWYLMRSSAGLQKHLAMAEAKIPFGKGPIVGFHVRRTDKIRSEAASHDIGEYMQWAELYFKLQESRLGKVVKRRVYIATDDPRVLREAERRYPQYRIFSSPSNAESAQMDSRYTEDSMRGVISDIHLLSKCDHLVVTFSSQVGRMAYELMQVRSSARGDEFDSLDDSYYFGGMDAHEVIAIEPHTPMNNEEIELKGTRHTYES